MITRGMGRTCSRAWRLRATQVVLTGVVLLGSPARAADDDYLLGPQDKLQVRILDVRPGTGEVHEWTSVTGAFTVGQSGALSMPLLGEVSVIRQTTAEVARKIAMRMQARIGLTQLPDASVEVVEYRPFYILGSVSKPNAYAYRPGLTVQQAVALAGGFLRLPESTLSEIRQVLNQARAELRNLSAERLALLTRQARLDAESKGGESVTFPREVLEHSDEPSVSRSMQEEAELLRTAGKSTESKIASFNNSKSLLTQEVGTLTDKEASLNRQLALAKSEASAVSSLVSKGFATALRQQSVEAATEQIESSKLDLKLAGSRAHQDMGRIDRDLVDLASQQKRDALVASSDNGVRLAVLDSRIENTTRQIADGESRLARAEGGEGRGTTVSYVITRLKNGAPTKVSASETDAVLPDDTVLVDRGGTTGDSD